MQGILDWIRGEDNKPTMQQIVDYNKHLTNVGDTQNVNQNIVQDVPLAPLVSNDINTASVDLSGRNFNQPTINTPQTPIIPTQPITPNQPITPQGSAPVEEKGFMDKVGDYLGNEENRLNLALAFNSMRLNPDDSLATGIRERLKSIRAGKGLTRSVQEMRRKALQEKDPTKRQKMLDMAVFAEQNPDNAKEILKEFMQMQYGVGTDAKKPYEPRIDETGKEYIPVYDPNTGTVERVYTGSTGLSAREKIQFETTEKLRLDDISRRDKKVETLGASIENIGGQINKIDGIVSALDEGAMSGFISNYFPTFQTATANLNQLKNQLGLDVIGSVTFGALSEAELKLAMDTAVPSGLAPAQLKEWAIKKAQAMRKYRDAIYQKISGLQNASGYNDWLSKEAEKAKEHSKYDYYNLGKDVKDQIQYNEWQQLNLSDRKELMKRLGIKP